MPDRGAILLGLREISTDLWFVALGWHVLLAAMLIAILAGWRPSERRIGFLSSALAGSVAAASAWGGNPFNALVFLGLCAALFVIAARRSSETAELGPTWLAPAGALLLAVGWVYPHFLETTRPALYLVAAPLGIIPCPTLFAMLGITLLTRGLSSSVGSLLIAAVALFYGAIGAFALRVHIDAMLAIGALLVLASAVSAPRSSATASGAT